MKKIFFFTVTLLFSGILFAQAGTELVKPTGIVVVKVTNINVKAGGMVKIGLYNDKSTFPILGEEIQGKDIEVAKTEVTYSFENVPTGIYAIAVFQDENNDGKQNTNIFGAPSESYGFSNNKYGMFGPPDFEDVSIELLAGKTISLTINLE